MDILREELLGELEKIAGPLGIRVVELEAKRGGKGLLIAVVVYKPEGVTIDDCEKVSTLFNARIELISSLGRENYSLQVASPGLYRVFKGREEYDIFRTRKVKMFLAGPLDGLHEATEYEGVLRGTEGDAALLEVRGETLRVPLSRIRKTKLNG